MHPKKTEEAICMKMSRAMFQGLQYQQRGDVVKFPANLLELKTGPPTAGRKTTIETHRDTDADREITHMSSNKPDQINK